MPTENEIDVRGGFRLDVFRHSKVDNGICIDDKAATKGKLYHRAEKLE